MATLGGAYWGAAALDLEWAFWVLVVLAAGFAWARWVLPRGAKRLRQSRDLIKRGRDYSRLLEVAAVRQAEVEELRAEASRSISAAKTQHAQGVLEGRRRVVGEMLAEAGGGSLTPVAIGITSDGNLLIAADPEPGPVPLDSLWFLQVKGMGAVKATLRVVDAPASDNVLLAPDHVRDAEFVDALTQTAATSSDFPGSLEIRSRSVTSIKDFEKEA